MSKGLSFCARPGAESTHFVCKGVMEDVAHFECLQSDNMGGGVELSVSTP